MNGAIGHRSWAIPGGHIPSHSTGEEPAMTSNDTLCVLNAGDRDAYVEVSIYYPNRDPVGPYQVTVAGRRVRHMRFNDLIDPEAIPVDAAYAAVVTSDVPIVVQYLRQDTRQSANSTFGMLAFPVPG